MRPLVSEMIQADPSKRPTSQEVVQRFTELLSTIKPQRLRSRLRPVHEDPVDAWFRNIRHRLRTWRYIIFRKPALPLPR